MPIFDAHDLAALIPAAAVVSDDERKIARLERGEVISLKRPPGEGWVTARNRFDGYGHRLGYELRLWWSVTGERWYVLRMK